MSESSYGRSMRRVVFVVLALVALLSFGCVSITASGEHGDGTSEEIQNHTFDVGENPVIDVTGFNGSINIVTGDDGEVDVATELRIPSRVSYSASVTDNTVTVTAKRVGSGISFGRSPSAEIHLVVPINSIIKARTSNGRIEVNGVTGDGVLETSNGRITLVNTIGTFDSSTSNGSIKMTGVSGQFRADTSNGRIEFSGTLGSETDNVFTTSNGSINIVFETAPSVDLDAKTSNGTVDSELPILATTTQKSHLVGKYGTGSASLELRTSNGSINIR
ncbi:DUF4097 family beta strand repeat protein [Dehalococcoides mccartyi]|nr:DUF4097 family beta strand repeat protein [Dehalococcoides mccartyi]